MIIPLKKKFRAVFVHPKRGGKTDNGTRTRMHRKGGAPDKFFCMCGGVVKMVDVFRNRKLQSAARCQKCGKERRKPSLFVPA